MAIVIGINNFISTISGILILYFFRVLYNELILYICRYNIKVIYIRLRIMVIAAPL
jgi:hypothetical protein